MPEAITRLALLGHSDFSMFGALRNALLFDAVGRWSLQIVETLGYSKIMDSSTRSGIRFGQPTVLNYRRETNALSPYAPQSQVGISGLINLHESLLGRTVSDCIQNATSSYKQLDVSDLNPPLLRRISHPGASVAITLDASHNLSDNRENRHGENSRHPDSPLNSGAPCDESSLNEYQLVNAGILPTITSESSHSFATLGLDLHSDLPPFLPVGGNEDRMYRSILSLCYRDRVEAHLPVVVCHGHPVPPNDVSERRDITPSDIISQMISDFASHAYILDATHSLTQLGSYLSSIAHLSTRDFRSHVTRVSIIVLSTRMRRILQNPPTPSNNRSGVASEIRRQVDDLRIRIEQIGRTGSVEISSAFDMDLLQLQRLIGNWGALLFNWPHLLTTAREMRARGIRPAV